MKSAPRAAGLQDGPKGDSLLQRGPSRGSCEGLLYQTVPTSHESRAVTSGANLYILQVIPALSTLVDIGRPIQRCLHWAAMVLKSPLAEVLAEVDALHRKFSTSIRSLTDESTRE